jgi:hypothetical protein
MERIGAQLGRRAVKLAGRAGLVEEPALAADREVIRAQVRAVPEADLRAAQTWAQGAASIPVRRLREVPQKVEEIKLRELLLVEAERRLHPVLDIEIAGLRVGDGALVALPGEIFAGIGRGIRAARLPAVGRPTGSRPPDRHTALAELANGCYGYVPTAEAFAGGGYETWLCRSSRLAPDTAGKMVEGGRRVLERLSESPARYLRPR